MSKLLKTMQSVDELIKNASVSIQMINLKPSSLPTFYPIMMHRFHDRSGLRDLFFINNLRVHNTQFYDVLCDFICIKIGKRRLQTKQPRNDLDQSTAGCLTNYKIYNNNVDYQLFRCYLVCTLDFAYTIKVNKELHR